MALKNEPGWDSFARVNAGQRFRKQSAAIGRALTDTIVREANIQPGMTVLDVASGSGEPAITAATQLNGTGRVIATDISPTPLKVAEERARERGLSNIEFQTADVHQLPFGDAMFDRILCRLGVMFFSDLPRALAELRRVLKPGGRITLLAWGPMEQPYFETTIGTVVRALPELRPLISSSVMFRFGAHGALSSELSAAGFAAVEENSPEVPWNWPGTPEELWEYFQEVTIPFKPLFQAIPPDRRDEVNREVLSALQSRYDGQQVRFDAHIALASATR